MLWILATPISSVRPSISNVTLISKTSVSCAYYRYRIHLPIYIIGIVSYRRYRMLIRYRRCTFDIVFRYRRCSISKVSLFDIVGSKPSISKVVNRVIDIQVLCLRYQSNILRYRILISYTISKVTLTFDIEGHGTHIGFDIVYDIALTQCHSLWHSLNVPMSDLNKTLISGFRT